MERTTLSDLPAELFEAVANNVDKEGIGCLRLANKECYNRAQWAFAKVHFEDLVILPAYEPSLKDALKIVRERRFGSAVRQISICTDGIPSHEYLRIAFARIWVTLYSSESSFESKSAFLTQITTALNYENWETEADGEEFTPQRALKDSATVGTIDAMCEAIFDKLSNYKKTLEVVLTDCRKSATRPRKYAQLVRGGGMVFPSEMTPANENGAVRMLHCLSKCDVQVDNIRMEPGRWGLPVHSLLTDEACLASIANCLSTLKNAELVVWVKKDRDPHPLGKGRYIDQFMQVLQGAEQLESLSLEILDSGEGLSHEQIEEVTIRRFEKCDTLWTFDELLLLELKALSLVGGAVHFHELAPFIQRQPALRRLRLMNTVIYLSGPSEKEFESVERAFAMLLPDLEVSCEGYTRIYFVEG
ncbi:hypothetical protein CB0940_05877 [Cercospora beticola]|uniref:F-box domain-containing protein n=1 Tax=Cercospora beticola TaxID=122368 RepID=A0A2G5I117_CERBT|nr:hypothetical protein CB0940_05877 [Cercospora beticola]PIA98202.1 hypothetical protein CB0940_05877 [Cercospora beticola]WPA98470.1 hypothetical protein RHO25_003082 [Cercospora beticola]CAK1359721.1 unnamed protein product [Cercospora beticola]